MRIECDDPQHLAELAGQKALHQGLIIDAFVGLPEGGGAGKIASTMWKSWSKRSLE